MSVFNSGSRYEVSNKVPNVITKQPNVSAALDARQEIQKTLLLLETMAARGNEDINIALNTVKALNDKVIAEINQNNYSSPSNKNLNEPDQGEESIRPGFSH